MASRRGLRLLALLAIAALLLLVQGAAAAKEDTAVTDATAAEQETALTKKKAAADDTAAGAKGAKSPPPPPAKKKKKQEDPAAAAATGTTTADKSPAKSPSPSPAPSPSPSPAPAPVAAPAPPPQPTYCPDGAGCQTIKLVFKIAGAPDPLSGSDVQNVMAAVNSLTAPVVYEYRTQQPAEPGKEPALATAKTIYLSPPPPSPSPPPPPPAEKKQNKKEGAKEDTAAADAAAADQAAADAAAADAAPLDSTAAAGTAADGTAVRRLQRRLLQRTGAGRVLAAKAKAADDAVNSCDSAYHFEVADDAECTSACNKKVENKPGSTVTPETYLNKAGIGFCCKCNFQADAATAAAAAAADRKAAAPSPGNGWWPEGNITQPLTTDGVFVFADGLSMKDNVATVTSKLLTATQSGLLCSTINENGVKCDAAAMMFQGTGDVTFVAGSAAAATTATSDSGLSTGAIVGICVGCAVGLAAVGIVIYMVVGCRRERKIDRAAKLRTMSRRHERMAATAPDGGESRWRQMYSQRMEESMRRAEEATAKQKAQANGPSFVEAQDKKFAEQVAAGLTPQLSSKRSFGRSPSINKSPSINNKSPQTPEPLDFDNDSLDMNLMAGSEVSSPPPSMSNSVKGGRTSSFKKLFSSGKK